MFQIQSQLQLQYFDIAPVPMFFLNASGEIVYINRLCETLLGEAVLNHPIDTLLAEPVWQDFLQFAQEQPKTSADVSPFTQLVRLYDSREMFVLKISPSFEANRKTYVCVLVQYPTEIGINDTLVDRLPIGMIRVDTTGQFIQVNPFFLQLLGYDKPDLLAKSEFDITFRADALRERSLRVGLSVGTSNQYHVDKRYIHRDGHQIWVRVFVSCVDCPVTQQPQFLIAVLDVHEEKQLHEVIATSERRFRAIADYVSSVVWISGADAQRIYYVNKCYETIWEDKPEALYADARAFLAHVHPSDRDIAASTRFSGSSDPWNINYRLLFADGRIKHIRDSGKCVFDGNGDLIYRVGTQTDVTSEIDQRDTVVVMAKKLKELVEFDSLTGIKSRHAILNDILEAYQEHLVTGQPYVLVYIDADGFKGINDNYGHELGDVVLKNIADHLATHIRDSDVAGRIGGDEFVVLLRHAAQAEFPQILERLGRDIVSDDFPEGVRVSLSLGAQELTPDIISADQWLNEADKKMYQNKRARKQALRQPSNSA